MSRTSLALLCWLLAWFWVSPAAAQPAKGAKGASELTLRDAYRRAAARSESVGIAEQGIARAEVGMRSAAVPMLPQAYLTGTASLQNPITGVQNLYLLHGSASLVQPVFRKGYFSGREAAELAIEAAKVSRDRAQQQVMLDVTVAFAEVLSGRQAVAVAEAAVQRAEAQESAATARVQAGGALRTIQLQAVISLRQAQVLLDRLKRDLAIEELQFERLVGIAPPAKLVLPPAPELPSLEKATALSQERGDLVALRHNVDSSRAREDALGGRRWPTLDVRGIVNQFWPTAGSTLVNTYVGAAVLTIPLFQGGDEWFAVQAQRTTTASLELQTRLREKEIAQELRTALAQLESARRTFELAEQQIKDAQENYGLVSTQFKLRTVTFIELAAAQSALTDAENLRTVSQFDRELAAYRLLFAIGTLQL